MTSTMGLYNRVDLSLDTFPCSGQTTTLDAAWMGVPTVLRRGPAHVSREGFAVLKLLGLEALAPATPEGSVEAAVRLASDLPKLAELWSGLRERMRRSPLCDGPAAARKLEDAYQQMWAVRFENR